MLSVAKLNSQDNATDIRTEVMTTATTCRITIREMIDLNLGTLLFLRDEIADAANGVNLHLGAALGKLLAQAVDVDLDRVRRDVPGMSEDMVFNLLLGDDAPLAAHQEFEHRDLAGRKQLGLIVDRGLPVSRVEFEIGDAKVAIEQVARPAQLRFQPGDQFLQRERLHQVVVGAAAQAMNAVLQAAARGQDHDRNGVVLLPYLAQQLQSVAVGQAEVEDQGRIKGPAENAPGVLDRRQDVGLIACRLQALCQELSELLVIFNDQQSHPGPSKGYSNSKTHARAGCLRTRHERNNLAHCPVQDGRRCQAACEDGRVLACPLAV